MSGGFRQGSGHKSPRSKTAVYIPKRRRPNNRLSNRVLSELLDFDAAVPIRRTAWREGDTRQSSGSACSSSWRQACGVHKFDSTIADHIRSELVVDAVQMAIWRRQPPKGRTVAHSDHGSQYTSWAFGRRLRAAGLLGSMGTIGDCSTTAPQRASLGHCRSSCSTSTAGRHASSWLSPCSTGSRCGTTRRGGTPTAECSARSTTNEPTRPPQLRHDQYNQPVRWTGGSSGST